jgi:hypothetical protein
LINHVGLYFDMARSQQVPSDINRPLIVKPAHLIAA